MSNCGKDGNIANCLFLGELVLFQFPLFVPKDLLPLSLEDPDSGCIRPGEVGLLDDDAVSKNDNDQDYHDGHDGHTNSHIATLAVMTSQDVFCFLTGDPRVNEQTVLCLIHTMMIRFRLLSFTPV